MINKYRIFDIEENVYCEEPDYRWLLTRNGLLYNSESDKYHVIGERYIVEFSTGQYDANGTEIFEGDKFSDDDGGYFHIVFDKKLSKFAVYQYAHAMYHNEGLGEEFESDISLIDTNCFDVVDLTDSVIIGNINQVSQQL